MSDLNKSENKNIDTDVNTNPSLARQEINSQQVSIKAWSQKLLVVLLCVASFYGGWKSYESNMVNECTANGGQMVAGDRTMICQLS
ncbi:hypothetical protein [Psychrobacter sp. Pi2-51]|uniref:hypothetical protein n=1 Tax=Psychrobacter sp. Pi2-51 TaxID=2774132 RepID=UPI00191A9FC4|nr:hypothetical protein [Psychrobacter sp. Pi2-51]